MSDLQFNFLAWSLGGFDKPLQLLSVSFTTTNDNALLRLVDDEDDDGTKKRQVVRSMRSVNECSPMTFSGLLRNAKASGVEYQCDDDRDAGFPCFVVVMALGLLGIYVGCTWMADKMHWGGNDCEREEAHGFDGGASNF